MVNGLLRTCKLRLAHRLAHLAVFARFKVNALVQMDLLDRLAVSASMCRIYTVTDISITQVNARPEDSDRNVHLALRVLTALAMME